MAGNLHNRLFSTADTGVSYWTSHAPCSVLHVPYSVFLLACAKPFQWEEINP